MYDYLAKIILLGPSGAGKYVLILRPPPAAISNARRESN
jgi:ribose 1,5-bisphosphokinase PhnN